MKIEPCSCGNTICYVTPCMGKCWVECPECSRMGKESTYVNGAISLWNNQQRENKK
ncbi:hypothetical protein KAR91_53480 [Candidatus Pacearchaeota archaeon]|nr:hypothetical protein [Candidatus Pacearchaeota archaeon]